MTNVSVAERISLRNILFLTDFSEPSEAALPFAASVAREYGSKIHAFHVLVPTAYTYMTPELTTAAIEAQEEVARDNMRRIESQLADLSHECIIERGVGIWPVLDETIKDQGIDLIVLGTHGRTGAQKLLLGSVAEEVFRRSNVPVLTIGPAEHGGVHKAAKFRRVLFATDFATDSPAAAPYAFSMAQENNAELILLHVMRHPETPLTEREAEDAKSNALAKLHEMVPAAAELWCRPEAVVRTGDPAQQIVNVAKERHADLIVLGIRDKEGFLGAATHLGRATAHKVVAHATCPVLTVRG